MTYIAPCKRGHDMSIAGRYKSGACKLCTREQVRANEQARRGGRPPMSRQKQFCPRGHDTHVVGRTEGHRCCECHRQQLRKARGEPREPKKGMREQFNGCNKCFGMSWRRPVTGCECGGQYQEERA